MEIQLYVRTLHTKAKTENIRMKLYVRIGYMNLANRKRIGFM